jgi:glutamate formiminotransferase
MKEIMKEKIACSLNISEGEDIKKIRSILSGIEKNKELKLLLVHSFKLFNRTHVYFMGNCNEVKKGAIQAIKNACRILDMTKHAGDHPRIGVVDTVAFIPINDVKMETCISLAHEAGKEVGDECKVPVFFYGEAAQREEYKELSNLRDYEYEGLKDLFKTGELSSDAGAQNFNNKCGVVAVGARHHTVNFKITINTNNVEIADKVAKKIRESGVDNIDGTHEVGLLTGVKASGFKEVGGRNAFLMLSLTNLQVTPIHVAYREVRKALQNLNYEVESTEIQGFVFKQDLIDAGNVFASHRNKEFKKDKEIISFALDAMKVKDFNLKKRLLDA